MAFPACRILTGAVTAGGGPAKHGPSNALGDWVKFTEDDRSTVRGRFTWISESTGRYLFTNRQRDLLRDITPIELAPVFKAGHAVIIKAEADPLFDRIPGRVDRQTGN